MSVKTPWAVLLCKFRDTEDEPKTVDFYERMYTSAGTGSLVQYWRDVSLNQIDPGESKVFGWLPISLSVADYKSGVANPGGRQRLVDAAWESAAEAGIAIGDFALTLIVTNIAVDTFGSMGHAVLPPNASLTLAAHESGHGFGLRHSRRKGSDADYRDPWDIMSAMGVRTFVSPEFGLSGPALNGANLDFLGWLDNGRVWRPSGASTTRVHLRPLSRPDLPGVLVAIAGGHYFEFRARESWDKGISRAGVLVHTLNGDHSYLVPAAAAGVVFGPHLDFLVGDVLEVGDAQNIFSGSYLRMEVLSIDEQDHSAILEILFRPRHESPSVGPGQIFGGVASDGGGFLIIGGRIIRVEPREPVLEIGRYLEAVAAIAETNASLEVREQVEAAALQALSIALAGRLKQR